MIARLQSADLVKARQLDRDTESFGQMPQVVAWYARRVNAAGRGFLKESRRMERMNLLSGEKFRNPPGTLTGAGERTLRSKLGLGKSMAGISLSIYTTVTGPTILDRVIEPNNNNKT